MSEQNLILLTNADPRSMLLSLLSRRTLEADSRDSYGFAVRPQHLQRYREYGNIYKEEEDERSEKWSNFLQQCSESVQSCNTADEHDETAETNAATGGTEGGESGGENCTSISEKEVGVEKVVPLTKETKRHNIKTWASLRPSLAPIDIMMSERVKNKVCMPNDPAFHGKRLPPSTNKKTLTKQNLDKNLGIPLPSNDITSKSSHIDLEKFENVAESECASDACPDSSVCNTEGQEMRIPSNISQSDALQNSSYEDNATSADGLGNAVDNSVTVEPYFPWKEELESLVHGGVPKSLRGEVWQAFVGVRARRIEKYYQKMLSPEPDSSDSKYLSGIASNGSSACTPEKLRKQIEKDLPRTFPGHPALDEEGRNSLRRILMAYARHNPSVGYCQAMNFFAGLFLLLMPEENAFWMLVGIIDDYFDGYYTHEMIESQVDQLVFEELMRERFPKLVNHLDYLGVEVAWVSGPWFLSIFMNMIPWESVLRVWDVLLYEGNRLMLFRTALALMELYGPALVTTQDAADAVSLLQSLTGSTFDSSQLVFTACMGFLSVTEARLEELREKHRPSVLAITEERTKGSEVSKESKSLARVATKLYSFKQDAQSLLKEPDITEGLCGEKIDSMRSEANSSPDNFDEFMHALSNDTEIDSSQDHPEQVVWLKVELCRLMEDKRVATLRAEELETAFLEMVKQDNRRELSAKVEHLEQEVSALRQALADKHEQEQAMLQVLMRVEQEQKVAEDARIAAEREVAVQKNMVHVLQGKYKKAMASIAEMEKRVVMAESMLQATLQYESGQAKALSSPRSTPSESPGGSRRTGLLSFGLGWRDKNKGKTTPEDQQGENRLIGHNSDD